MSIDYTLLLLLSLLAVALTLSPLLERVGIGRNVVLMVVGFVGSEIVVATGHDTGVRWNQFHEVVIFVLLPVLIFEGALHLDTALLRRNISALIMLAGPGMLLVATIVGVALYYGTNRLEGAGWLAAGMAGVLLAGTDATSVTARLGQSDVPPRLRLLVEGESNFSDAMSVVLVSVLLAVGLMPQSTVLRDAPVTLMFTALGGLGVGAVALVVGRLIMQHMRDPIGRTVATLVLVYITYLLAESVVMVSGVMSLLVLGVGTRSVLRTQEHRAAGDAHLLTGVWAYKARLASSFTFLLLGITVHVQMFQDHWRLMLVGIVLLPVARIIAMLLVLPWFRWLPGAEAMPLRQLPALVACGAPGAVSVALVLSLPLAFQGWYTVQSIVYGVVVFSLLVQSPLVAAALRLLEPRGR